MVGLTGVNTYLQGVSTRFGLTDQNPNFDPANANRPQDPNYPINPAFPRGWGNSGDMRDEQGGVVQQTVDQGLICRMFGVCRNAEGRVVLDPSGGGVYRPNENPGDAIGGVLQHAGEATGLADLIPRIATIALGGALIITGLFLSRASIVANVASAVKGK